MTMNSPRKTVSIAAFAIACTMASSAGAESVVMSGSALAPKAGEDGAIVVKGSNGRFDRAEAGRVSVTLKLDAKLEEAASNTKIVESKLFLKQSGTGAGAAAAAIEAKGGGAPAQKLATEGSFDFEVDPQGPVAQSAIALCNATRSERDVTMASPVIWRVTAGRFNFKWVNYDKVAPSPEIVANPDFYADKETHEIEIAASIPVTCDGAAAVAVTPVKPQPAKKDVAAKRETKSAIEPAKLVADQPKAADVKAADEQESETVKSVSLETPDALICDGGMVRKLGSAEASFACLCPGNTHRVETGENAYSCEKRNGRRS